MTVIGYIEKNGWNVDVDGHIGTCWNVDIGFVNSENRCDDETEFSISAFDANELEELFVDFCKENQINSNTVTYVSVVEMADSFEELS
jgi:hypothetical protein